MWPALALALLVVAVWHWGVSTEPAQAQDSTNQPSVSLNPEWQWMGESVTLSGEGFTPGGRVWAYVGSVVGRVPSCRNLGVDENQVDDGKVASDGTVSFDIDVVSGKGFMAGDDNYLCLIDYSGLGLELTPARLRVVEPPPAYRMRLDVMSIENDPGDAFPSLQEGSELVFPDNVAVDGAKHFDDWTMPQERRVGSGDDVLVRTNGTWYRCEDKMVDGGQTGCVWEERPEGNNDKDAVFLKRVRDDNSGPVSLPGNVAQLRLGLKGDHAGVARAADRFVIFWGPVDIWMLGAGGGVGPQDFVIQGDHLVGLQSRTVVQSDLDENGYFTLDIDRFGSANRRGDTFVAIVPCNDDYLEGRFSGDELDKAQKALGDCSVPSVSGLPFLDGQNPSLQSSSEAGPFSHGQKEAWSQHDARSGLGMRCDVAVTGGSSAQFVRITCDDVLDKAVTREDYGKCMDVLSAVREDRIDVNVFRNAADLAGDAPLRTTIKCGRGHYHDNLRNGGGLFAPDMVWSPARYNAARAFYGFVINWQRGSGSPLNLPGCDIHLLPSRRTDSGLSIGYLGKGTELWELGERGADEDSDCEAGPGVHELDVVFYTPAADKSWTEFQKEWHDNQVVHFAVYVSGLPSAHDYRANGGAGGGWRRVWTGSRAVLEGEEVDDATALRPLRDLGIAYPDVSTDARGIEFPRISAMSVKIAEREETGGYPLTITRDYADDDGAVRLYVVPCRPLYAEQATPEGRCADLPDRLGGVDNVRFSAAASTGPFGLERALSGHKIHYSLAVTVMFRSSAWGDDDARAVSPPREWDSKTPAGSVCGLSSVESDGELYWPEVTVAGGSCDRSNLEPVSVTISNVAGGREDNLVLYATGGRTPGLGLVQIERVFGGDEDAPLGRMGVRERLLALSGGSSGTVLVSPDIADRNGDVWIVAYSCGDGGGHGGVRCPRIRSERRTPVYDVAHPPSFAIRVRFLPSSGLVHSELGPVCQGDDCAPRVPILRDALPDGGVTSCEVSSYRDGMSGLFYWPDRLVRGGACAPPNLEPVKIKVGNIAGAVTQHMVFYATGGRDLGLEEVQVRRGAGREGEDGAGAGPAGAVGLRQVRLSLDGGETGSVLVDPDLADQKGQVLVLAYLCSGLDGAGCPVARGDDSKVYAVDRRPLFQVLVQYDADLLAFSSLSICRGDSCADSYPLGRLSAPDGPGCSIEAEYAQNRLYWPEALVTGADCERHDLRDVPVSFVLPAGAANESLTVYVTGGRSRGLEEVSVLRAADQAASAAATAYVGHLVDEPVLSLVDAGSAVPPVVASKSWVTDGLTGREREAISWLRTLGSNVDRVGRMPFLNDFDELDYLTLRALSRANRLGVISDILGHAALSSGIGNEDRVKVIGVSTMVHGDSVTSNEVANIRSRLASSSAYGPSPVIREGFSVIVATSSGERRDDVANEVLDSVLEIERLMERDFPTDHVLLFLDEASVPPSPSDGFRIKGVNFGYAMSYLPDLSAAELSSGIAHEVAHYYWRGADQTWLHEGVASAFEVLVGGDERREKSEGCTNLRNLVEANPGLGSALDICNYYLGQRLFLDLHRSLGDDDFYAGLRRLYDRVEACQGPPRAARCGTIDDVRATFPDSLAVIDQHWGLSDDVGPSGPADSSGPLGRLGLRERQLTLSAGQTAQVLVSPDLADQDGNVWLFAYRCVGVHGDRGCPLVNRPAFNGYDLPVGPTFAVRVRFTPESGLAAADLKEVCKGQECDIVHPWLRRAEPDIGECGARLGTYWPDRVIRGGECYVRGSNYGSVVFKADAAEKFVVYTTGDGRRELDLMQVYGVLRDGSEAAVDDSGEPLGRHGLRESLIELAAGGEERTWVRVDMADDDGNVWLFVYRCEAEHGDAGCPLVDRDQVRPSYDVTERPSFVVRVSFVSGADAGRSTLEADCSSSPGRCELTATFRDAEGTTLPGTVEFRVDRGMLGETDSTAQVSQQRHQEDAAGNRRFKETLILPTDGGMVNVEAELLGDGTVLTRRVGRARNVARLSAEVMRCSGDAQSCHAGGLTKAEKLLPGDHFVLAVTGYDASSDVALPVTKLGEAECRAGRPGSWPTFRLNSGHLRSYGYGTSQPADRGYAGCAIQVSADAPAGTHGITASYRAGAGAPVTVQVQVVVGVDTSKLGYLVLSGPSQIESGESGTYRVVGLNLERLQMGYDLEGGCVKLDLSGALEGGEGGSTSALDGCLSDGLPKSGVEFTVQAKEDVIYQTDSSIGVSYNDISVSKHVLVVPAEDRGGAVVPSTSSHISNLTIAQEGGQLSVTWNGDPRADFESMRAQVWVVVGGEDVFLPGCEGGEVHDATTEQVFCLLSYGQSGDVYHAAVGFIRYDNSAVPVETAQWTRP